MKPNPDDVIDSAKIAIDRQTFGPLTSGLALLRHGGGEK
jgi:hypothetical protein